MADDLNQDPEIQVVDSGTREDVAGDVRASIASLSNTELGDKLTKEPPANETETQKADRLRDESGKFVAKDKVEAPVEAAPKPITDAVQPTEQAAQPSPAGGPPRGWSAEEKAMWATLPPAIQTAVSRRESQFDQGALQRTEQIRQYEQAFQPVQGLSQQYGLPGNEVINRLVAAEQRLQKEPAAAIAELAQAYGVDLTALVNGSPQPQRPQAAQQFDPNIIPQIVQQSLSQALAERDQQSALQSTIDTFKASPGHEHFESVKVLMGNLLKTEQAADMQEAYDMAIKAKGLYTAPVQQIDLTATKAKKAAISLNGSPRGQAPVNRANGSAGTVMDDVRAAFAQHAGS